MRTIATLLVCLLSLPSPAAPVDVARYEPILRLADAALAGPRSPARAEAMAALHRATLELGDPARAGDRTTAWWFAQLRQRLRDDGDPEVDAFLRGELRLDPAGPVAEVLANAPVAAVPYRPGQGTVASLADCARSLDLGETPRLTSDKLRALAVDRTQDVAVSTRALILLRRLDPAAASPLLWQRLRESGKRSDALFWEEQLSRLPPSLVGKVAYDPQASPAVRAVWLRLAGSRSVMPIASIDRAGWIELLKGPANELTEAAWDAVPRAFAEADRSELTVLAQSVPERIAPRARLALDRLR